MVCLGGAAFGRGVVNALSDSQCNYGCCPWLEREGKEIESTRGDDAEGLEHGSGA